MGELDYKASWVLKNRCVWTGLLEKTLESPLERKEIQSFHPKGNQSWIFVGRIDAEAETPILWPPDVKNWHPGKDPDAAKDWRQQEKGMTEDETLVFGGQGGLGVLQSMGLQRVGHDWLTELNWTELNHPDGQNSTLISVGSVLVTASTMGMMGRTYIPRTEKEVRHLWLPRSSLMVNKNVHPLDNFLQELIEINAANKRNKENI